MSGCKDNNRLRQWNGTAFGAPASIKIRTPLKIDAKNLIPASTSLARRIEEISSLSISNSHVSFLNEHGQIYPASPHLINMINTAREVSEATQGAFDITVQPLLELAARPNIKELSTARVNELWAEARSKVGYKDIAIDGAHIRFNKPGMKITLNGIAPGYTTEQISTLLQERGVQNGMVNFGEYQAFGKNLNGTPWRVEIPNSTNSAEGADVVNLKNQALALSTASKIKLDGRTDRPFDAPSAFASARVFYSSATLADVFATAFVSMEEADIRRIVKGHKGMKAVLIQHDGKTLHI